MAEIHIQRKKNVWPWVIAFIVVLLLIGGALMWMDGNRVGAMAAASPTAIASETMTDTRAAGATASTTGC